MADQDDRRLEQKSRALYRRRADALEPEVRKRLAEARREALARAQRPAGRGLRLPVLVPAGAAAAVAAAAVILLIRQPGTDTDYAPVWQGPANRRRTWRYCWAARNLSCWMTWISICGSKMSRR